MFRNRIDCALLIPFLVTSWSFAQSDQPYTLGPDSMVQAEVPTGTVETFTWKDSQVYPGTIRRFHVYVPAQYDESVPAALMVFQDGHAFVDPKGWFRAPTVFDNLIHQRQMPVTIGLFVDPGHRKEKLPEQPGTSPGPENRSVEYDSLDDKYVTFLLTELIPQIQKKYRISDNPEHWGICGNSSGGICAFTAAWQRPDRFRKVISHIGSFTNIRGGHVYPALIRSEEKRPLRVFIQAGQNDLDNRFGNWPLANQQMDAALRFKDYDSKFVMGVGGHSGNHGGSIFPDTLRWIWRDFAINQEFITTQPESRDADWWIKRHQSKLAEKEKMGQVDLLMVGDSITHSWENGGKATWDKFYADRKALNIGFSGDRTEHVLWRIENGAIDGIRPRLTVIMIGTNNTGHRQDPAIQTAAGINRIIGQIQQRIPETKILLLGVFPRGAKPNDPMRQLNVGINEIIETLADQTRVWYLNIDDRFLDEEGTLPKSIMPDFLHPNEKGYEIWAEAMEPMIRDLLDD